VLHDFRVHQIFTVLGTMRKDNFTIRAMTRKDVDVAIEWAAAEGWNPGLADANCFHAADPGGFFVGLLDDEPIATISAVKYGESFAFVGFYIVKPGHRGQGFGLRIWNAALATVKGRNVGLDGVVDQQGNYRKSGFALAYRNVRYAGAGRGRKPTNEGVVPLSSVDIDRIDHYDRAFFREPRTAFLRCWIQQPGSAAVGILARGRLAGYAVLRACRSGYKIGPLFADNPEVAERLFNALLSTAPASAPVFLDVPEVNLAALDLVRRHEMTAVFETARMYTGEFPDPPFERLFGVTSFELG
jgi:ribosomal protein S18 acetylase RimI-like enzyme